MRKANWWIGVSVGVAAGLAAVAGVEASTDQASAQSAGAAGFTLSTAQLQINQRISQAAVRRTNQLIRIIQRGLTAANFQKNSISAVSLDQALRK